ncbi:MAG TPA: class I SAM-dependent methyltransferase [Thermoanaerobaculia bacterium]|nr:class I SAM-dependent methyltransferase [Thermoanaerobaculia bacterium]
MAFRDDLYPDEYFEQLHRVTKFAAPERKWRERDRDILSLARPTPEKTVLDLGSALGDVCFLLAPHVAEAVGVDASPRAVELAEERRRERGFSNVRFLQNDVAKLAGVADASVDVAGAFDLLEHVDDDTVRRMLGALRRVLKPGGVFVAYTPNREHYVERLKAVNLFLRQFPEHIAVRRPREIRQLLEEKGWRVQSIRYSTAPFPVVRWIERALAPMPLVGGLFRYRILVEAGLH